MNRHLTNRCNLQNVRQREYSDYFLKARILYKLTFKLKRKIFHDLNIFNATLVYKWIKSPVLKLKKKKGSCNSSMILGQAHYHWGNKTNYQAFDINMLIHICFQNLVGVYYKSPFPNTSHY